MEIVRVGGSENYEKRKRKRLSRAAAGPPNSRSASILAGSCLRRERAAIAPHSITSYDRGTLTVSQRSLDVSGNLMTSPCCRESGSLALTGPRFCSDAL